jgi:Uma2 family endonuclease
LRPALAPDAIEVPSPIIVEVLSPHSAGRDAGAKLEDYFRLPSVVHYLLFKTERPALIHHRRHPNGTIETSVHHDGTISLEPPGIPLDLAALFA